MRLPLSILAFALAQCSTCAQVVETECVHPLASIDDFKARLGKGKQCYGFFHPLLPEVPRPPIGLISSAARPLPCIR
jgi:hypothetical protein